jgi:serine/threonine protein phosphatase PrpC
MPTGPHPERPGPPPTGPVPVAGPVTGSVTGASRRGRGHAQNEDRWAAVGGDGVLLLAVADGMGGMPGGGPAASAAVQALLDLTGVLPELAEPPADPATPSEPDCPDRPVEVDGAGEPVTVEGPPAPADVDDPAPDPAEPGGPAGAAAVALAAAVASAHERVRAAAAPGVPDRLRPGTTLTAALVLGDRYLVAHVGDSGCWLLRRSALYRLTEQHTHAAVLVAAGALDGGSPAALRLSNLLTQHLGMAGELQPQYCAGRLRAGDRLLLATDGLTRALPAAALAALLARPEMTAARLVGAAVAAGARDDVTALLATIGDSGSGYAASVEPAAAEPVEVGPAAVAGGGMRADAATERQVAYRPDEPAIRAGATAARGR